MAEPILAASDTWFTQMGTSLKRSIITEIEIKDSYTPAGAVDSSWDASAAKDGSVMVYVKGTNLIIAGNGSGKVYANPNSSRVFSDSANKDYFSKLTKITGGNLLDTSKATTMMCMFQCASSLATLDVSNWNTGSVTSMVAMFNMGGSYINNSLTSLDLSDWDVSKVTSMQNMFASCNALVSIGDTADWDTSSCKNMSSMFNSCFSLGELNASNWDVSSVTTMQSMFRDCRSLESLNVTNWNPESCTDMSNMYTGCTSLEELNVSNWDVSKVTTFRSMFSCGSSYGQVPIIIKELDVSNWNTSSATDMSFMFYGCRCSGSRVIDVSNWDVSKVTNFDHMFAHSYFTLTGVDNWAPSTACTNMNAMFHSIQNTRIDVSKYNTSKVTVFDQMFQSADKLTKITGLENFDTSAGLGFSEMFRYCSSLKELDLSSFDTTKAKDGAEASTNGSYTTTMSSMFAGMKHLEKITLGENFSFNGDGTTTDPSHHAILPTPASGYWYRADGTAYSPADVPSRKADTYYATADREDGKINWGKLLEIYCFEGIEIAWLYYKRMKGGGG